MAGIANQSSAYARWLCILERRTSATMSTKWTSLRLLPMEDSLDHSPANHLRETPVVGFSPSHGRRDGSEIWTNTTAKKLCDAGGIDNFLFDSETFIRWGLVWKKFNTLTEASGTLLLCVCDFNKFCVLRRNVSNNNTAKFSSTFVKDET